MRRAHARLGGHLKSFNFTLLVLHYMLVHKHVPNMSLSHTVELNCFRPLCKPYDAEDHDLACQLVREQSWMEAIISKGAVAVPLFIHQADAEDDTLLLAGNHVPPSASTHPPSQLPVVMRADSRGSFSMPTLKVGSGSTLQSKLVIPDTTWDAHRVHDARVALHPTRLIRNRTVLRQ